MALRGGKLTFEQWRDCCFLTQGDEPALEVPGKTVQHLTQLFQSADSLVRLYSAEQIARGVWYIFGIESGMFHHVTDQYVAHARAAEVYASMETMYRSCFDVLCNAGGTTMDDLSETAQLDGAVYMIWDMDCVESPIIFPDRAPHLVDPAFRTLETVLFESRTTACMKSALHALGHLVPYHRERCGAIFAGFFRERGRSVPEWLFEYASAARTGMVQ